MNEPDLVEVLADWPQPDSVGEPRVRAGEGPLRILYATSENKIAVVEFPLCHQLIYGHPNDEVLHGHSLYQRGLQFYAVHRVANSSRLAALERANSIHPHHDAVSYLQDKEHYVFTFQDATLECLVTTGQRFPPKIQLFETAAAANAAFGCDVT
jgi:hypothetical protein